MRRRAVLALAVVAALWGGCRREPAIAPDLVVRIDGHEIRYAEFLGYLRDNADADDESLDAAVLSQLFDQFLAEELLIRLAIERGLDLGPETLEPADHRRALQYLLRGLGELEPDDSEVAAYYESHRAEYERQATVRLRQILVDDRSQLAQVEEALAAGEDFAAVAERFSQGPAAPWGGDQGRLARDDLPPAFADEIFNLEPGEVSEAFAADYGFHIFQVVEYHPAEVAPLAAVAAEIRTALRRQRVDKLITGLIAEARGRYHVEIYVSNLPFPYRGAYAPQEKV